ncbi:MAG: phosphopentomutase [Clostridia bacterium]|nr:phosphopentomutase [Clostridia bacterium]
MLKIKRVLNIVLDACGVGSSPDAAEYGDEGANTLLHVIQKKNPDIPNLMALGLGSILGIDDGEEPVGCYGRMREKAAGKDTTSGHWELAGYTLKKPFPVYPNGFPQEIIDEFEAETGMQVIGNRPASGTQIIQELGDEHFVTGKLIVYTSADSVFQIAAHEDVVPPQELYHICRTARRILKGENCVGRVIARPFIGETGSYTRTGNRRDFSVDPFGDTMLDVIKRAHMDVLGIGKIEDIFNHRGLTQSDHAAGNDACIVSMLKTLKKDNWKGLCFVNLVDTDSLYGHRRDVDGFAESLEAFDSYLPDIMGALGENGVLMINADHGCDPTFRGTDHTREEVPLLVWGLGLKEGVNLGTRATFADNAKTVCDMLGVENTLDGTSFYPEIRLD